MIKVDPDSFLALTHFLSWSLVSRGGETESRAWRRDRFYLEVKKQLSVIKLNIICSSTYTVFSGNGLKFEPIRSEKALFPCSRLVEI